MTRPRPHPARATPRSLSQTVLLCALVSAPAAAQIGAPAAESAAAAAEIGAPALPKPRFDERLGFWFSAGTVLAGAVMVDALLQAELAAPSHDERLALTHLGNRLGQGKLIATTLAATYGAGHLLDVESVARPAGRTLAALVAAGAVGGTMKVVVGRERPDGDGRNTSFRPLNFDDRWQSFPSGHVVTAFALATAISEQSDRVWVTGLSYGAAGLVGWSRIHENRHWTSDVVAGALVGTVAARTTVRYLERRSPQPLLRGRGNLLDAVGAPRFALLPNGVALTLTTQ